MKNQNHALEIESAQGTIVRPHSSFRNILVTLALSLGSFLYGYTSNIIAGSLAFPSFNEKFLYRDIDSRIGGILGIFLGGGVVGAVIQAPVCDRFGRRVGMMMGAVFLTVGGALEAGSVSYGMFIVARFLAGIGSAVAFTIAPVYISELAPAHSRGFMVALHVVGLTTGYLISSIASLGFSYMTSQLQWRLNFVINTVVSLFMLVLMHFVPESPRWLVSMGRIDEAARILKDLHTTKHDPTGAVADAELIQIKLQVERDLSLPRGYLHICRTPSLRKRAYCTILVWFCGMATGVLVIANLTPLLFAGLGYGSTTQFGLSSAWLVVCILSAFVGGLFVDRFGRVNFLVIGGALCTLTLALEAAMQAEFLGTDNKAGLSAGVAWFFLFAVAYNAFFDAGSFVYTAEIWPTHLRSEGVTIAMVTFYVCALAYNIPAATALRQIGWKYYLVFICITTASTIAIWFYLPETSGMTLEEIGEKFGEPPSTYFRDIDVAAVAEKEQEITQENLDEKRV